MGSLGSYFFKTQGINLNSILCNYLNYCVRIANKVTTNPAQMGLMRSQLLDLIKH